MASLLSIFFTKANLEKMLKASTEKGLDVTISVNDEANQYRQNVSAIIAQSKEQRDAKYPKVYLGNGGVVWTDGKVTLAPKKDAQPQTAAPSNDSFEPLPF
jgi:hypothetical protein